MKPILLLTRDYTRSQETPCKLAVNTLTQLSIPFVQVVAPANPATVDLTLYSAVIISRAWTSVANLKEWLKGISLPVIVAYGMAGDIDNDAGNGVTTGATAVFAANHADFGGGTVTHLMATDADGNEYGLTSDGNSTAYTIDPIAANTPLVWWKSDESKVFLWSHQNATGQPVYYSGLWEHVPLAVLYALKASGETPIPFWLALHIDDIEELTTTAGLSELATILRTRAAVSICGIGLRNSIMHPGDGHPPIPAVATVLKANLDVFKFVPHADGVHATYATENYWADTSESVAVIRANWRASCDEITAAGYPCEYNGVEGHLYYNNNLMSQNALEVALSEDIKCFRTMVASGGTLGMKGDGYFSWLCADGISRQGKLLTPIDEPMAWNKTAVKDVWDTLSVNAANAAADAHATLQIQIGDARYGNSLFGSYYRTTAGTIPVTSRIIRTHGPHFNDDGLETAWSGAVALNNPGMYYLNKLLGYIDASGGWIRLAGVEGLREMIR